MKRCAKKVQNFTIKQEKTAQNRRFLPMAERKGFEPLRQFPDDRISSAARYDHFDISPI